MKLALEDLNILLVSGDTPATQKYKEFFTKNGIRYYIVTNNNQIENILQIIPINGIVVDVGTFIKIGFTEKHTLNEMEKIYPFIRVKWDVDKNQINAIHHDPEIKNLPDFINIKCCHFDPRIMRNADRKEISFNVVISDTKDFSGIQERTCTLNASASGFFIITCSPLWQEKQKVYVVINELSLRTPIQCTIIRKVEWGEESLSTPGISVQILSVLDQQQDELLVYIKK